jgi:hypothetical protein
MPDTAPVDADGDRVDDALQADVAATRRALKRSAPTRGAQLQAHLAASIRVELIFASQVTQQQIDAFLALGGEIDHVFEAVSYGWTGRIHRAAVESIPAAMGPSFVLVAEEKPVRLLLDEATRTGRVRPVWASGFAGSVSGFSGDSNITIGIIDTGVDESHPDLAGRQEYWADYTSDNEPTARDIRQHGTHVAAIALGTGAAFGVGPGTLTYTDSGDLTGLVFVPSPIHLPPVPLSYTQHATWLGGGSTDLYGLTAANGTQLFTALSPPTFGSTGIVESNSFVPVLGNYYTAGLYQNPGMTVAQYAVVNTATPYPAVGDGFNALRGVAPLARWAGAKVFKSDGGASNLDIAAALDDMVVQRTAHNIKIINMSIGGIIDATMRAKTNTAVNNGILAVAAAGNDGPGTAPANLIGDPGRAALALTVAASNDYNELTQYTSSGAVPPAPGEDLKPDLMAPGGSHFYSGILAADSNDADALTIGFADRVANDYYNIAGTSMAAPFAAGAAALVIDALQQQGLAWSFASNAHPRLVKLLLCASATESNAPREVASGADPILGRAAAPKDRFEGYGLINPDAAIEAVSLAYTGGTLGGSTAGGRFDRRAWGRKISLAPGIPVDLNLAVPATADFDLYLYSSTPDSKGNPVIRASSTKAGLDADENIRFTPASAETAYLFVKRVAGSGTWSLSPAPRPAPCGGVRRLNLTWLAKDPQNLRVAISATRCPQPPQCTTAIHGRLLSQPPVSIALTDNAQQSFRKVITDPGINSGGCPGKDDYRGADRMRFIYGAFKPGLTGNTTLIGKLRLPQTQLTAPILTPPIYVDIRDATGPLYTFTVHTCYPRITPAQVDFKCI